jgi:membrane peptidoglycan carboxypeptidase
VCVVYVGFDENDELGMKGADSALPIWADFMRQALNLHPEWNGDWMIPDSVKKAEIDSRDGKVLRELDEKQAELVQSQQSLLKKNAVPTPTPTPETPMVISSFINSVPLEFRRVELFVSGTIPIDLTPHDPDTEAKVETKQAEATPTPFETWQESQTDGKTKSKNNNTNTKQTEVVESMTVMVCEFSGMRATINCPKKEAKTFKNGTEPKDFCSFHRGQ